MATSPLALKSSSSARFDVCVRGAGIVGRVLALLLARAQLRVALVPGADVGVTNGHSDVRAYALNHASRQCLESLRCWPADAFATPVASMQIWGDDGGALQFQAAQAGTDALAWIVDVPALESLLVQATQFQSLIEVVSTPVAASLTVICEGRASTTRDELGVEFDAASYGHSAIAARLAAALPHEGVARQWFGGAFSGADGSEILALLPLQGNSVALVWSVEEAHAQTLMTATDADFCQVLQDACHGTLGALQLNSPRQSWPLQLARAKQWVGTTAHGAWALAGDAAHNLHPLSGQGLNLGLGDAMEMARVLAVREAWRGVADGKLLRAYERARKLDTAVLVGATDGLQRLFGQSHPAAAKLRNQGMAWLDANWAVKYWVARRAMGAAARFV
jgi:2-polyprenyl-6-methoxyphenol hydroxylase-like FAD-dependent oxidoreductase